MTGPPRAIANFTGTQAPGSTSQQLQVRLSWDTPSDAAAGYSDITGYDVQWRRTDDGTWETLTHSGTASTALHALPIPTGQATPDELRYRVRAHNKWTQSPHNLPSPWSDELVLTRNGAATAGPPQNVRVETTHTGHYRLTWDRPANADGFFTAIRGYEVRQRVLGTDTTETFTYDTRTRHTMRPTAGQAYSWEVVAVRLGIPPPPATPATPVIAGTPTAPAATATGGMGGAQLTWHPGPDNGHGDPDLRWQVSYRRTDGGGEPTETLAAFGNRQTRTRRVDLPAAGTYEFQLWAVNRWGNGAAGTATATTTVPTPRPAPTTTGTATITGAGTTHTLTGPTAAHPGTVAVYRLTGGDWNANLGVATVGVYRLRHVEAHADGSFPACDFGRSAVACVHRPVHTILHEASSPISIVAYQGHHPDHATQVVPFTAGAELRVQFAADPTHVGQSVMVGFQPVLDARSTLHWNGATPGEDRRIEVTIAPTVAPRPPPAVAVVVRENGDYRVAWIAPADAAAAGIDAYEVYRRTAPETEYALQETVPATQRWSELAAPDPALVYRWYVRSATVTAERSAPSQVVATGLPDAPTDVTATGQRQSVQLSWSQVTTPAAVAVTGYRVERSGDGITGWTARTPDLAADATAYVDDQLRCHRTMHYRVRTLRDDGTPGPPSNRAHATVTGPTPRLPPTAPRAFNARTAAQTIILTWDAPAEDCGLAITGYRVQRSDDGTTWADATANTGTSAMRYVPTAWDYGVAMHYRVAAINAVGTGPDAAPVSVTTPALVVPGPVITVTASYESLTLRWPAVTIAGVATVAAYEVQRYDADAATWGTSVEVPAAPVPSFTDGDAAEPLPIATAQRYRVRTRSAAPHPAESEWVEVTGTTRMVDADFDPWPGVGPEDALFLHHVLTFGGTDPTALTAAQTALLMALVHPAGDADAVGLAPAWRQVQLLREHDSTGLGDLNQTAGVDAADAELLYYASAFAFLLGDGTAGGYAGVRELLLGEPSGWTEPTDAQLRGLLERAQIYLRSHAP